MSELAINYKLLHPEAKVPTKSNFEDAGWDLYCIGRNEFGKSDDKYYVEHGKIELVNTGLAVSIPRGFVGLIWDRSGLACRDGIHRLAGVIDSGYTGEIVVALTGLKLNQTPYTIYPGDKIAQLIIQEVPLHVTWNQVKELEETDRGTKGFGSSGR